VNRNVNDRITRIPASEQIVPDVRKRLNALINVLCRAVNELHREGMDLETPPQDGLDFFVPITEGRPLEMGNIQINPKILAADGLNYICASESGATEDNVIALAIANLRNLPASITDISGETTYDDYYRSALLEITNRAQEADRYLANQETVTAAVDELRHSIMDVSMDEELSNMMKFKFGYDAAARVLNVIDSMIETIISRLGLVGR
jgi:flagellar hook-associated protein 1 FlgK